MATIDKQYKKLAKQILLYGFNYQDESRNNISMLQIPDYKMTIPIYGESFPLLTSKKVNWNWVAHELIWMLSGSDNIDYLVKSKVPIWDQDAHNFSSRFKTDKPIDQLESVIRSFKSHPFNRRHIVTAWNPSELPYMALPPCHWSFELIPTTVMRGREKRLSFILKWHQRSVDAFLGLPFDIASYAFLGLLIQKLTGITFKTLIGDLSNVHFYGPHIYKVRTQIERPTSKSGPTAKLVGDLNGLDDFTIDSIKILKYNPEPYIKAELFTKSKAAK